MTRTSKVALLLTALNIFSAPALAQEMSPAEINAHVTDLSTNETTLHLDIDLKDGWKTYYKGQEFYDTEMKIHWKEETGRNIQSHEILWPDYEVFDFYGQPIKGYSGEVNFPIEITWKEGAQPDTLSFDLEIYFCSNLCIREEIPYEISLTPHELTLPWRDQSSSSM